MNLLEFLRIGMIIHKFWSEKIQKKYFLEKLRICLRM